MGQMPKELFIEGDFMSFVYTGKSLAILLPLVPNELLKDVDKLFTFSDYNKDRNLT